MFSLGQKFWSSVAGRFWLRVPHEAAGRCQLGLPSSHGLTGPGGSALKPVHLHGRRVAAGYRQGLSPSCQGSVSILTSWQQASHRADLSPRKRLPGPYGLASSSLYCISHTGPALIQCERGLHKGKNTSGQGSLEVGYLSLLSGSCEPDISHMKIHSPLSKVPQSLIPPKPQLEVLGLVI